MEYTPENIVELKSNEIFVFGSNARGIYSAGAAKFAKEKCGAIYGQPRGIQGQSYAIVTKKDWRIPRSSTLDEIFSEIEDFILFANRNPEKRFLVTKLGSQYAGYSIKEIKSIFERITPEHIPKNVILPKEYEVRMEKPKLFI